MRIKYPTSLSLVLLIFTIGNSQENPPELPGSSVISGHKHYVSCVAFSKDGNLAASSDMIGNILVWEVKNELKRKTFRATNGLGVEKWVWSVALSPDGKLLAAGSDDKTVWVWEIESRKLLCRVRGHEESVVQVFFFPDSKKGVSIDRNGTCLVWENDGQVEPVKLKLGARGAATLSPDGKLLCFSNGNDTILADLADGKKISTFGEYCADVAFSRDGNKVLKGNNSFPKTVELWDIKLSKRIWASKGHNNEIKRVLFTPDGKRILSIDGVRLHVWDAETGDEIGRFQIGGKSVATCIACAPDGKAILIGDRQGGLTMHNLPK